MNNAVVVYMSRIVIAALCIAVGFFGTLALLPKKENAVTVPKPVASDETVVDTDTSPFTLQPPSLSLRALLSAASGDVQHKTRDAGAFVSATPSATIVLGESIATGTDGNATISIPSLTSIDMGKNAELVFANVFKENTVLQQKAGGIAYRIESVYPVAIRALRALVSAKNADITITIKDTDVTVVVETGEAKVGIVDSENTTHVYTVTEGNQATIDNYSQSVRILSPR